MAVRSCDSKKSVSAGVVGDDGDADLWVGVYVWVSGRQKEGMGGENVVVCVCECECVLVEEQRCWATKQEVAAKEGFAVD